MAGNANPQRPGPLVPADPTREDLSVAQMEPEAAGALQATLVNPNLTAAGVPGLRVELANAAGVAEIAVEAAHSIRWRSRIALPS
jgi:hypothetical protein